MRSPKCRTPIWKIYWEHNTNLVNQLDHSQQFGCKLVFLQDDECGETFLRHFFFCPIITPLMRFKLGISRLCVIEQS